MKLMLKYLLECLLGLSALVIINHQADGQIESALEDLAEKTDQTPEDDALLQQLQFYKDHPLNLNTATASDLSHFYFLNILQIHALLQYRKLLNKFISLYELQAVPGFSLKDIYHLLPYVTLENNNSSTYTFHHFLKKGKWSFLGRYKRMLEKKRGFTEKDSRGRTHYLGDPNALFFRLQYQFPGHLRTGLIMERDAGEPFSGYGQKGFDFYAGYFFLKDHKKINTLALGDYRINLGQGLINRQGLTFGKSSMVMMTDRSGDIIQPHSSAMEYGFYRGGAISLGKKHLQTTLFLSYKPEDANLLLEDTAQPYIHGLQSSGYHRSVSELQDKDAIHLFSAGGNLKYDFGKGHIAWNAVYHHFSDSVKKRNDPYKLFAFEGKKMLNMSIDYALSLTKLYFFGETATNLDKTLAMVNGLLMSVDPHVDISLLYRYYSPRYTSLFAEGFGESSSPQNESGFYTGIDFRPAGHWQVGFFADFFRFPWLKYRTGAPSQGDEYFMQVTWSPTKQTEAYVRYRYKKKSLDQGDDNDVLKKAAPVVRQNVRLNIKWLLSPYFSLRDRMEIVSFSKIKAHTHYGYLFYQDILWKAKKTWSGNFRFAWFHTADFDTRIYTYENNVRYAYSIPFFYGKGIRSYANFRMDVGRRISLWTKIARTWYFDQKTIGSGWDKIQGNKKTRFILELIWEK